MGPEKITNSRIVLSVEQPCAAPLGLDLYLRNRLCFEQFEPTRPDNFYTLEYHRFSLHREYIAFVANSFLRYYIYDITNPDQIIGSVNFNLFSTGLASYCEIGYKLDVLYQHRGIAEEACRLGMQVIQRDYGIYRFDARISPDNHASVRLAERLGLKPYRLEPQSANVRGQVIDIMRCSVTTSDTQYPNRPVI